MRNPVLEALFTTGQTVDAAGETRDVFPRGISRAMGEAIAALIFEHHCLHTMEVGCAFGVSSMFICDALTRRRTEGASHVIIDPWQTSYFAKAGILNLERADFDFFELIEEPSERALPKLWEQGRRFDFALIDGRHTMDQVMLDFFYIDKLLNVGGIIVFDDISFPGVAKAVRFVSSYPSYQIIPPFANPKKRHWKQKARRFAELGIKFMPISQRVRRLLFSAELLAPGVVERAAGAGDRFLAMKKQSEDNREYVWHVHV